MGRRLDAAVADTRTAVRAALSDLTPGSRALVACSGGADSLALAAASAFEGRKAGWLVGAVVVDHGLQPTSADVAARIAVILRELGCEPVDVVAVSVTRGSGPEAAAREARYAALTRAAESLEAVVLLGHTLDDQAETVLLGLARGSGLRSLAGMAPVTGRFRRPLLGLTRHCTEQACRALGLDYWDDPHNRDPRFQRVRVRRTVLPMLEEQLGPGVAEALARTARLARFDADALDHLAEQLLSSARQADGSLDVAVLSGALPSLRRRVLRSAALAAGCPSGELFAVHIDSVDRLVTDWHGQLGVDLPGAVHAVRRQGLLAFEHPEPQLTSATA
jgi:tRNA(Ile)-lysidine synthase